MQILSLYPPQMTLWLWPLPGSIFAHIIFGPRSCGYQNISPFVTLEPSNLSLPVKFDQHCMYAGTRTSLEYNNRSSAGILFLKVLNANIGFNQFLSIEAWRHLVNGMF